MSTKTFDKPQVPVDHNIHPLISERWSPRAFDPAPVRDDHLNSLFESARWAASSMNEQPWQFLYARKGSEAHQKLVDTLMEGNQPWQKTPLF